jgi:acyl-CoA hydrolase
MAMIIIENDRTRLFSVVGAPYVPDASDRKSDPVTQPIEDLTNDPEVCRRVGELIAENAKLGNQA